MIPSPKTIPHGMLYEEISAKFLLKNGHKILYRNYKVCDSSFKGEIDIISQKNEIVFLNEVKGRKFFCNEYISQKQRERIWYTYQYFLEKNGRYIQYNVQMQLLLVVNNKVNILDII